MVKKSGTAGDHGVERPGFSEATAGRGA